MDRKRIVVGVSGGIAAYKACTVVRQLAEAGHDVRVIPTDSALRFVGAATFEALSGNPVHTGVFTDVPEVPHVRLGQQADLVVVAPATADRRTLRPFPRFSSRSNWNASWAAEFATSPQSGSFWTWDFHD